MAASNINRVVLTGNLTRDPELRSLQSGTSVCSLRIASNSRRKDGNGEWVDKPNYFSVTVWGAQGENCARFLSKGRPVCIDGRLDWREWQAQDGSKRESVEIVAESVQFLGSRDDSGRRRRRWRRRLQQRLRPALRRPGGHVGLRAAARRCPHQRAGGRRHPVLGRDRVTCRGPPGWAALRRSLRAAPWAPVGCVPELHALARGAVRGRPFGSVWPPCAPRSPDAIACREPTVTGVRRVMVWPDRPRGPPNTLAHRAIRGPQ